MKLEVIVKEAVKNGAETITINVHEMLPTLWEQAQNALWLESQETNYGTINDYARYVLSNTDSNTIKSRIVNNQISGDDILRMYVEIRAIELGGLAIYGLPQRAQVTNDNQITLLRMLAQQDGVVSVRWVCHTDGNEGVAVLYDWGRVWGRDLLWVFYPQRPTSLTTDNA